MDYLTELGGFAARLSLEDVPAPVREHASRVVLDLVACIGAGMQSAEMRRLAAVHLEGFDDRGASIIGGRRRAPRAEAAFLNATAGVWDDYDEGNLEANGHPGIQLVPAVLAFADERRRSGADALAAIVAGYEVSGRIGSAAAMHPIVHPHGTFGVIGTAVAIGRLEGLSPEAMRNALNIAAALANASNRNTLRDGATVRNAFAGHANYMGQVAVRLAQAGFSGERDAVATTFGAILGTAVDPAKAAAGLGTSWLAGRGYFKLYPNGRFIHSAMEALEDAVSSDGWPAPEAVRRVSVRTFGYAARLDNPNVATGFQAKFSVPFALATMLQHRRATLDCFDDRAAADPRIADLVRRIAVREEPAFSAAYPERQISEVEVALADGAVKTGRCEEMRGGPSRPLRSGELERKFLDLATPVWGAAAAERLRDGCLGLEAIGDFAAFASAVPLEAT